MGLGVGGSMAVDGETANSGALVRGTARSLCARFAPSTPSFPRTLLARPICRRSAPLSAVASLRPDVRLPARWHLAQRWQASLKWDQWKRHTPLLYDMLINNNLTHPSPCVHWGHKVADDGNVTAQRVYYSERGASPNAIVVATGLGFRV
jgi:hypothetical protein